jgi:DNA-binding MarR family transcriptional regulator
MTRLSRLQHRILAWLAAEEARTRGTMAASHQDLVHAMGTDKSNLSRSLMRLEDRGLITITRTPGRKAEAVALTRRGQQVVRKPEVVLAKPMKRWRKISTTRWDDRLVEVRRYVADLDRGLLLETLAETWKPEVQAGYHRELLSLAGQLTGLVRRLEDVMSQEH